MTILLARKCLISGAGPAPADIATLITALGGNGAVAAFYDCRTGLTILPGNLVSAWADARGGGFGPTLVQATGSKQPTIGGDGSLLTVAASLQNLFAAANALFNIGGSYTLIFVGAIPGTKAATQYACSIGNASTALLGITQLGASNLWGVKGGGAIVQQQSATSSVPATYRVVIATLNGTTVLGIQCPTHAITTQTIVTPNANASAVMTFGGFNGASGNGDVAGRAIIALPSLITAPQITAVGAWATPAHGTVPSP